MPYSEELAGRIRKVVNRRAKSQSKLSFCEKKMFGGIGFLLNGNMCVGVWRESLIVRIGLDGYETALSRPHASEFDITGRAMRGWVMVDELGLDSDDDLKIWVSQAIEFVRSLPAKS